MEPHEIDRLFGERLKNNTPTPSADLWNRLQERIETELPAPQQEKKPVLRTLWTRSYSIAAAITLLLAATILFFTQRDTLPGSQHQMANTAVPGSKTEAPETAAPAAAQDKPAFASTATEDKTSAEPKAAEAAPTSAAPATTASAPASAIAQVTPKAPGTPQQPATPVLPAAQAPVQKLAVSTPAVEPTTAATDVAEIALQPVAPVALASATPVADVQPVEIIIIRSSDADKGSPAASAAQDDELTGFEKKQRLAKGIFRQARNLTSGEPVDLSDLGINASKIAFETQIGKQKFSKVINL